MQRKTAAFLSAGLILLILVSIRGISLFSSTPRTPPKHAAQQASASKRVDKFWARAMQEVYRSPDELKAQDAREKRKGLLYAKLMHGNPASRQIALTFDDGPHPKYTRELLAILKRYNVKATFFVVGFMAERYPVLVSMENAQGHLIANHTYHHVNLTRVPDSDIPVEWQACNDVIKSIIGRDARFARPPGGDYDAIVIKDAMERGLITVLWTDDPGDYAKPGDKVIETRVLDRINNGGIILLHDGVQQTVDVLPQIIETLQRRGFKFVTVDEMERDARSARAR